MIKFLTLFLFALFPVVIILKLISDNRRMNEVEKLYKKISAENEKLRYEISSAENHFIVFDIVKSFLLFLLYKVSSDYERSSYYYNELFFMGMPKELIDDVEKGKKFICDLMDGNYTVMDGEEPFKYRFIKSDDMESDVISE